MGEKRKEVQASFQGITMATEEPKKDFGVNLFDSLNSFQAGFPKRDDRDGETQGLKSSLRGRVMICRTVSVADVN